MQQAQLYIFYPTKENIHFSYNPGIFTEINVFIY